MEKCSKSALKNKKIEKMQIKISYLNSMMYELIIFTYYYLAIKTKTKTLTILTKLTIVAKMLYPLKYFINYI